MRVGLATEIDASIDHLSGAVSDLSLRLKAYFETRSYGDDVQSISIGVVLTGPGTAERFPTRGLRYRKLVKIPVLRTEMKNVVEFDVRPDFDKFRVLGFGEARAYVGECLIESLGILDKHREKFPNFDTQEFARDFAACVRDNSPLAKVTGGAN